MAHLAHTSITGYRTVHIVDSDIKTLPTFLRLIISSSPKLKSKNEPWSERGDEIISCRNLKPICLSYFLCFQKKKKENWNSVWCLFVLIKPGRLRARNLLWKAVPKRTLSAGLRAAIVNAKSFHRDPRRVCSGLVPQLFSPIFKCASCCACLKFLLRLPLLLVCSARNSTDVKCK